MQIKEDISAFDLSSRLCLLLLHFPNVKIIWSSSPYETARIFAALKRSHSNPIIPHEVEDKEENSAINTVARELLLRMPGINTKNIYRILRQPQLSLVKLSRMSCTEIQAFVEDEQMATELYRYFNQSLNR